MNIEIANRLAQLRKQHGFSQESLAGAIGISRQAVSKWERAEASPDTDNLILLARLYGVSLDELLGVEPAAAAGSNGVETASQQGNPFFGTPPQPEPPQPEPPQPEPPQPEPSVWPPEEPFPPDSAFPFGEAEGYVCPDAVQTEEDDPSIAAAPGMPGSLSPLTKGVLKLGAVIAGIILFIIYGIISLFFPVLKTAYPVFCTVVYLILGVFFNRWHPDWMIFLSVPLFNIFFGGGA